MLTDKAAKAARPKPGNRYRKLFDQGGLYLFCAVQKAADGPQKSSKVMRSWRYDYRLHGMRRTFAIGLYPTVGLAEARERHQAARKLVALGKSPVVVKREARHAARLGAANTVRAIADAWYNELAPHKSDAWRKQTRAWLDNKIYPSMGNSRIAEVTPADVLALCKGIAATHPKTGEYIRLTLSRIFSYAIRNLRAEHNPAREMQGVIVVPSPEHHEPLPAKAIPDFIEKLDGYPGRLPTKLAAKLLLLTMVRKRELIEATWDEVDLEDAVWTIPAARMKRREGHVVPLSRQAQEAFKELKPLACGSRYVFPSTGRLDSPMGASTLNVAFERMKASVTPHGLRSTASTVLNESGAFRPDVIERQLSHIERNRIRASYNRAEYLDERRTMLQWWADFIDKPMNVVALRRPATRQSRAQ
jgi:integrase